MAGHYHETRITSAIIRNNEGYLSQNIRKLQIMLEFLHKSGCLTEEQLNNIRCSRPRKQRKQKLAQTTRSFSSVHYSKFIRCLRHTEQHQVADVAANGGGRTIVTHLVLIRCIRRGRIWNFLQYYTRIRFKDKANYMLPVYFIILQEIGFIIFVAYKIYFHVKCNAKYN